MRTRSSPQQLLAVSFALIMLVSMGGLAFVGGAGAQQNTGGTYDDIADTEESISQAQNIAAGSGEVVLLYNANSDVHANDDGSINFSVEEDQNDFAGVAIDEDRYAALFDGVTANGPADQLSALDDISITNSTGATGINNSSSTHSGAYPAVLIELAPQSDFSQNPGITGEDDYIFIVGEASAITSDESSVGAFAVDSDRGAAGNRTGPNTTELATGATFGEAVSGINAGTTLSNDNIDQVRIGAGIGATEVLNATTAGDDSSDFNFQDTVVTDIDVTVDDETRLVHNEKIALDDGDDTDEFFATINNSSANTASSALRAATDGDQITVATGNYSALESGTIAVDKQVTLTGANGDPVDDRLDDDFSASDYIANETVVGANISLATDDITLENLAVGTPDSTTQNITSTQVSNVTITNTIVNGPNESTAVDLTGVSGDRTVDNVAIIGNTSGPSGGTGLNVSGGDTLTVENSFFTGYTAQVAGASGVNETVIYDDASNQFSHAAVAVNDTGVVVGNQIAGTINSSSDVAAAGNTIEVTADDIFTNYDVTAATYSPATLANSDAADLSLVDVDDGATIDGDLIVDSDGDVSVTGFVVNGNLSTPDEAATPTSLMVTDTNVSAMGGNFTLDAIETVTFEGTVGGNYTVTGATDVSATNAVGDTFDVDATTDVSLDQLEAESMNAVSGPIVNVTTTAAGDIDVTNSNIHNLNASDTGLNISAAGVEDETVTVSNVTVTGASDATSPAGINVTGIYTSSANNAYELRENDLTGLNNGVGIDLDEQVGGNDGPVIVDGNEIRSDGTRFIGIAYNMSDTTQVNITANTIVGGDVAGANESVGVNFEEVAPFSSSNVFQTGNDDVMTFEDNVITGHARLIQDAGDDDATIQASGYNAILTSEQFNNSYGTHVVGADGATYADTYGEPVNGGSDNDANDFGSNLAGAQSYVPGSINQSLQLVDANADNSGADLVVTETDVGVNGPTSYDDESVVLPDLSAVSITGAAADGSVTAATNFSIDKSGAENNHSLSDLTVVNMGSDPALAITSENAQVDIENLDVTTNTSGLVVTTSEADVNVVDVTDSRFNVTAPGTDGIVLNSGEADDRDGFVIDNVTVDGPGIGTDASTGLNLTGVDKPGKAGLPVNLTVTDNEITDFETIVAINNSDNGTAINATTFLEEDVTAGDGVTVGGNTFTQAIVVNNTSTPDTLETPSLYGSLDKADADATDGDTIEIVGTGMYDHEDEVTITTANVTVTGPTAGVGAADRTEDVIIQDPLNVSSTGNTTIERLAVVPNNASDFTEVLGDGYGDNVSNTTEAVIGYTSSGNHSVANTSVSTALDSDNTGMPAGIAANESTTSLTVKDSFVGAHDDGTTTGTGIVAEDGVTLEVTDSTLADGADGADGTIGNMATRAYGVLAANNTTPAINGTTITNFDRAGVNTESSGQLRVDGGTITDNDGTGIETNSTVTSPTGPYEVTNTMVDNNGAGITLQGVGLTTDAVVTNNNGVGVNVSAPAAAVDIEATNISANTGSGVVLDVNNTSITNSEIGANDVGIDVVDVNTDSTISQNDLADNGVGLNVTTSNTSNLTVRTNDFANTNTDIKSDNQLDATLNYFNSSLGPNDAAGVADTVTYDPFLTESQVDTSASDVADTTSFGHDVVIPENNIVSVGFPAEPQADTVGEVINGNVAGSVYMWDQDTDRFNRVSPDEEINAFDVLIVENVDDRPTTAAITYKDEGSRTDPVSNTFTFDEGLNFVPAQQVGTVEEALVAGSGSDYVAQPFASGENLYGDERSAQVRDQFTNRSADGFGANFASGVGENIVHPHVGYFVIVNEESTAGNTRSEQIPSAGVPTAADIAERTGRTPATFELSSASARANASDGNVSVIVDVENIGDVNGTAALTATARTGFDGAEEASITTSTITAGDDTTAQLTINGTSSELDTGDQVRVAVAVDGTDESVTVTTQAETSGPV